MGLRGNPVALPKIIAGCSTGSFDFAQDDTVVGGALLALAPAVGRQRIVTDAASDYQGSANRQILMHLRFALPIPPKPGNLFMTTSRTDLEFLPTRNMSLSIRWWALLAMMLAFAMIARDCLAGGMAFDADGNLFLAAAESVFKIAPDGTKTTFATGLNNATCLTFDRKGNLFVVDSGSGTAFRFAPDGTKTPFMTDITSSGMAFDGAGNLFIGQGHSIYKFTPEGTKSTFATGLGNALDLAFDPAGTLYVLDSQATFGESVFKFAPDGKKSDFLRLLHINPPGGLTVDSAGAVYLTQVKTGDATPSIFQFGPDGKRSVFAAAMTKADTLGSIAIDKAGNAFLFNGEMT